MPAPKVADSLSKRERKLVAEIRTLKSRLAGFARNELESKEAQEKIESLARFPSENPYPVLRISLDGTILYANEASTGLLIDKHSGVDQPAPPEWREFAKRVLSTGAVEKMAVEHAGRTFAFRAVPVMDANYCNLYGVDITEHKQAEEKLKESQERLGSFMNSATDGFILFDSELNYVEVNKSALEITDLDRNEILGKNILDVVPDLKETGRYDKYREVMRTGMPLHIPDLVLHPRFGDRHIELKAFRVGNGLGMIFADVTARKRAEEELRNAEANLKNTFNISPGLICAANAKTGYFTECNPAVMRVLGFSVEEFTSRPFMEFVHPDDRQRTTDEIAKQMADSSVVDFENRYRCKDGSYKWLAWQATAADKNGKVHAVAADITERKKSEQELFDNQSQLKSLASELVLAEERERNRIAVHLHDNISQSLAYSKMKLQVVNAALDDQTQINDMTEVCDTLTRMMQEVHSLTFELSSPVLTELGLEAAVSHWLTEQVEQKQGIATEFTDDGQVKPLEEDIRALLFRSVRELLANVVKHSQANRLGISISRAEDQVLIRLEDDGIGFAPDKVVIGNGTGGFGLFSIRERLSQMGGSLEIDSSPGQGCRSLLRAPLTQS